MATEFVTDFETEYQRKWLRFPALVTRQQAARAIGVTLDEFDALEARREGPVCTPNGTPECYRREHLKAYWRQQLTKLAEQADSQNDE